MRTCDAGAMRVQVRAPSAHVTHLARVGIAPGGVMHAPVSGRHGPRAVTLHKYGVRSTEYDVYGDRGPAWQRGVGEPPLLNGYLDLASHACKAADQ